MNEEIIIDKEDKTKKHRNNEIDCLHFGCRKGESGNVLFWCHFYDDHCDNYTGCYYRKYLRLEQENKELKAYKDVNEDFKKAWDELNRKYTEVLKLAKENADSNEYCLQELEQKYEQLRSALEEIREVASFHTTGADNEDVQNDMQVIIDKINEVLK